MKLVFLGTAAAEGFPGIFCNCANCNEARAIGGKSIRFRSALMVNNDLLIDFGPDLLASAQKFNLNLSGITTGLVTHAHADHFHIENFHLRRKAFTGGLDIPTLRIYGPGDVTAAINKSPFDLQTLRLDICTIRAFDHWTENGYIFDAFQAFHAVGEYEAVFYSVSDGQNAFLYVTDTGKFPEETWNALAGKSYDVIIMEETLGVGNYPQHMGFETFLEHADKLRKKGILQPGGRLIAHHMSHSGNPVHEKLETFFAPYNVEVAYDGMEVVI